MLLGKQVYTTKEDTKGMVVSYKARQVICGNRQRPSFDFDESYAPIARPESIRLFLTIVYVEQLLQVQIDYTIAYLNAKIDKRYIFIREPTGYKTGNSKDIVCVIQ